MTAQRARLADGRWHFQHGPIDLVIGADGAPAAVAAAHAAAWRRFETLLGKLVAELPLLRRAVDLDAAIDASPVHGHVALAMWHACRPFAADDGLFITPMAAVAGAVADAVVAVYRRPGIARAYVNNGGDIALHLAPGEALQVGLMTGDVGRALPLSATGRLRTDGRFRVDAALPVRGVATSGWRGRSLSLGIADSVTVLARTAAEADAAASIVANAVDSPGDSRIVRRPACDVKDDSDLGRIPVTVGVPTLDAASVDAALNGGLRCAEALRRGGSLYHALLVCQGRVRVTSPVSRVDAVDAAGALIRRGESMRWLPQNEPAGPAFA